jgi:hypothetical protein
MQMDWTVIWAGVSAVVAIGALVVSGLAWLSQKSSDRKQDQIQERLAKIEEARRQDEIESRNKAQEATLVADVRVCDFGLSIPGSSGDSDKIRITVENRGPAPAMNIDVALMEDKERAPSSHLGGVVEEVEGNSHESYFQIPWGLDTPRPLEVLRADDRVTFSFWFRYRLFGSVGIRVSWEDGRGSQVIRPFVQFDPTPTWRH